MKDEINRTIHEARGLCWHEFEKSGIDNMPRPLDQCRNCKKFRDGNWNPDYHTPEGLFSCWREKWFWDFLLQTGRSLKDMIEAGTAAPALAAFLKARGE